MKEKILELNRWDGDKLEYQYESANKEWLKKKENMISDIIWKLNSVGVSNDKYKVTTDIKEISRNETFTEGYKSKYTLDILIERIKNE